jgi:peptidoglycan/xylan/chitin deacetylase (PgdA/CDA1 family)
LSSPGAPRLSIRTAASRALLPLARLWERASPGIRILMYHRVDRLQSYDQLTVRPERFCEHMALLAARERVVSLAQAVQELRAGPSRRGVALTFDDGYRDNLVHATPLLARLGLPATVFVTAEFCGQTKSHPRYPETAERLHLDWDEVRQIAGIAGFTIGSHTLSHPYLQRLSAAAADREIRLSRTVIAERIGHEVEFLCYPSGDVTEREQDLARAAGYLAAVTVAPGRNKRGAPLLALRRTEVTDHDTAADLAAKLDGAFDLLHLALHAGRRRAFARAARAGPHASK